MPKFSQDKNGEIQKVAASILKEQEEFEDLRLLKFLFTWIDEPRTDEEKQPVAAQVKVLPAQWRDITGCDVQIEVCEPTWRELDQHWRRRLVEHEFRHVRVEFKENKQGTLEPARDKQDRIKVKLVPHDIVIKTFKKEVKQYGLSFDDMGCLTFLKTAYQKIKAGKLNKYAVPKVLRSPDDDEE